MMKSFIGNSLKSNAYLKVGAGIFLVFVFALAFAGAVIPNTAEAVIDTGTCWSCGGGFDWGFWGWGGGYDTHLDGGGGGGCFGQGCFEDPEPSCTITANPPGPVTPGSPVTLTWTSVYAQSASVSPGVGAITPVTGGSVVVNPTVNTTYVMTTQHGTWGSATCQVTVNVTPPNGCIQILKETFNTNSQPIFPVAQFTFKLDGNVQTAVNDASGIAIFNNVTPGTHTVTEIVPPTWQQLSVTPANGVVIVPPGPECVAVVFKNKQVLTPPPTCTLVASPNAFAHPGGETTLTWTTTNANQISIDEDVNGPMVPIAGGSVTADVTEDMTFHFTATGPGGTVQCEAPVTVTPNPPVTIKAKKVVCDTEADLPNWGGGAGNITSTTAEDYVASHPNCHIELGWKFQWADGDTTNPGDNVGIAGGAWTTFVDDNLDGLAEATINLASLGDATRIWMREALPADYVPFAGIGLNNVSAEMYCHTDVLNYDNFDQILNPVGGQTYNCVAFNAPKPPPSGNGCIEILKETYNTNGDEITPVAQFTFKLDGNAATTQNNASGHAIFNNVTPGVHTVTEVLPATWTQLSVTPVNGTVTVTPGPICAAVVFKNKQVITQGPACTLTASPTSFNHPGGTTQLTWTTTNATSFTINNGVGAVTPVAGGNVNANVTQNTTFVGTATGPNGTVTCEVPVTVVPPQNPVPACTLTISKNVINTGESVVVTWTSSNVTSGNITPQIGNATPVGSGNMTVFPPSDTTYTGTFTGPYGSVQCSVFVKVNTGGCQGSCGGGYNPPNVVLFQKPGEQPLASVFLAQIPYTGFEAGPILTTLFWLGVALFAALVAFYIVGRGSMRFVFNQIAGFTGIPTEEEIRESVRQAGDPYGTAYQKEAEVLKETPMSYSAPVAEPLPMPVAATPRTAASGIPEVEDVIESRAHAAGVLMSPEAVSSAASLSSDRPEALRMFGDILNEAVKTLPREDGWIMLTSDRFAEIRSKKLSQAPAGASKVAPAAQVARTEATLPAVAAVTAEVTSAMTRAEEASAMQFVGAVLSGDRTTAFNIVRSLEHDNVNPTTLITGTATVLDRLYRVRHGGQNGVSADLMAKAEKVNDETLHKLVEIFTHALDTVYSNPFTGLKLALAQAFEIVG